MDFKWINRTVLRQDAPAKTTGETKFMSDLSFPGMLWGGILRSEHPHALIKNIDCEKARKMPGVVTVLTHEDVPGLNAYGIAVQDQPVLCADKVRFMGDAVALVAAENRKALEAALSAIKVDYELLPLVDCPEEAVNNQPALVHAGGNLFLHTRVANGDVEKGAKESDVIVENTYTTSRQMHGFLETEGGVAAIDEDGNITIWCGSHHPHRDKLQIARSLKYPEEKINVIANPVGGGFGGKDEITVQIHMALLTLKTGRPVKIVLSREESIVAGWKRHPMKITLRTGAKKDGSLTFNEVTIYSDTGAYASLGASVLNVAIENSSSAYRVPNVLKNGYCVYTNNGISGAMRGFGDNQATFAMETQMDLIARELGIDPLEIRLKNGLRQGDQAAIGHTLTQSMGTMPTLEAAKVSPEWQHREHWKQASPKPWIKRGVGVATALKGVGLGRGIKDYSHAVVKICPDGTFKVAVGCPDVGQGNNVAFAQMAAEALGVDIARISVVTGDTSQCPDSGTSTASRTIYAAGNAIIDAAEKMRKLIDETAGAQADYDYQQLAKDMARRGIDSVTGRFDVPVADKGIEGAPGLPHLVYSAITNVAMVEVNTLTGECRIEKVISLPDAGRVINLQGLEGQAEGGVLMGMGYALVEDVIIDKGRFVTSDLSNYIMYTSLDTPEIRVLPVEELEPSGPFGAKGIGEAVSIAVTPAITNAIMDATGITITSLPATPERVLKALKDKGVNYQG